MDKLIFTRAGESPEAGSFEKGDTCPERVSKVTKESWLASGMLILIEGKRKKKVEVKRNGG